MFRQIRVPASFTLSAFYQEGKKPSNNWNILDRTEGVVYRHIHDLVSFSIVIDCSLRLRPHMFRISSYRSESILLKHTIIKINFFHEREILKNLKGEP